MDKIQIEVRKAIEISINVRLEGAITVTLTNTERCSYVDKHSIQARVSAIKRETVGREYFLRQSEVWTARIALHIFRNF